MRAAAWFVIAVALVFQSGCRSADWIERTLVTVDVTGVWEGSYRRHQFFPLTDLTSQVTNGQGQVAGPFMANVPPPPSGWAAYTLNATTSSGVFNITTNGDGTTVSLP